MSNTYKITGNDVLRLARRENLTIHCHANPIDDGGIVTLGVAQQIAKDNPSLIYAMVVATGWRNAAGKHCDSDGRTVEAYFFGNEYLGPDCDGVEPCWNDASLSDDAISAYLSTLSADARADWAACRIDEVMADHATSHFGVQINGEITRVAAAL